MSCLMQQDQIGHQGLVTTPCNLFLWGYVKSRAYVRNPKTIFQLKEQIQQVIGDIEPESH